MNFNNDVSLALNALIHIMPGSIQGHWRENGESSLPICTTFLLRRKYRLVSQKWPNGLVTVNGGRSELITLLIRIDGRINVHRLHPCESMRCLPQELTISSRVACASPEPITLEI